MPNYTKLFNSIVTSTIWTEDDKTRIVWITMLALSDQNGEIQSSIPGLARLAGVSVEAVENAINTFMSPDEYSRTPDNEGRRIAKIDGGWELLNHAKYRRMASLADRKESTAKRQKRFRDRNAPVTLSNATVTHSNAIVTQQPDIADTEAEAEADTEASIKNNTKPLSSASGHGLAYKPFLKSLWSCFNSTARTRSSMKEVADEWSKINPKPNLDETIESAKEWAACYEWTKEGGQYAPAVHLWIKRRKWEGKPAPAPSKHAGINQGEFTGEEF